MMPSIYQNANKTNGISIILECQIDVINNNSMLAMPSHYETEPDRDLVLQDQKVLPDVTKQPLLLRVFSAIKPMEIPTKLPLEWSPELHLEIPIEIPIDIPIEIPIGIPIELPIEMHLELPLELPFEIPTEIPPEISPEILFEIPHRSKTPPPTSLSSFSLVL